MSMGPPEPVGAEPPASDGAARVEGAGSGCLLAVNSQGGWPGTTSSQLRGGGVADELVAGGVVGDIIWASAAVPANDVVSAKSATSHVLF